MKDVDLGDINIFVMKNGQINQVWERDLQLFLHKSSKAHKWTNVFWMSVCSPKLVRQNRTLENIIFERPLKDLKTKFGQKLVDSMGWLVTWKWQTLHQPVLFCGRGCLPGVARNRKHCGVTERTVWHSCPDTGFVPPFSPFETRNYALKNFLSKK